MRCESINSTKEKGTTMKIVKTLILATSAITSASSFAFIQNGSFENGLAYPSGPNIFSPGTPSPWVATQFTPDLYDNSGADGWGLGGIPPYTGMMQNVVAAHGKRFIGFAVSSSLGFYEAFGQNVSGLNVNQSYTISAMMLTDNLRQIPNYGGPYTSFGQVDVYFNNSQIGSFLPNTSAFVWQARSLTFTASAASGFLEFRAATDPLDPARGNSYMALDNFEVVPEPSSACALFAGAGIFLNRIRKRKSSNTKSKGVTR